MMKKFIELLSNHLFEAVVEWNRYFTPFGERLQDGNKFKYYSTVRYATDVNFQQADRPSGNMQEGRVYISGKHKLHGFIVEDFLATEYAGPELIEALPCACGWFRNISAENWLPQRRAQKDKSQEINRRYCSAVWRVPQPLGRINRYRILRAIELTSAFIPKKKPPIGNFTWEEKATNKKLGSNRIIVEHFFGRLCSLRAVVGSKWRGKEDKYDLVFRLRTALSNVHVQIHPLRSEDNTHQRRIKERLYSIGDDISSRRRNVQERYRKKRRRGI